jgi:hypothetical protein
LVLKREDSHERVSNKERKGARSTPGRQSAVTWIVMLLAVAVCVALFPRRLVANMVPDVISKQCPWCRVLHDEQVFLPFTGAKYHRTILCNPKDQGPVYLVWLPSGVLGDEEALLKQEQEARWNSIGALDPSLFEMISSLSEDVMLPVYIWGKVDLPDPDPEWLSKSEVNRGVWYWAVETLCSKSRDAVRDALAGTEIIVDAEVEGSPVIHALAWASDLRGGECTAQGLEERIDTNHDDADSNPAVGVSSCCTTTAIVAWPSDCTDPVADACLNHRVLAW